MPLRLITGPPNSGRTERLRELFVQAERRAPCLVVPSVGDIFAWERRLTETNGAFIGARVFHFRDMCAEIIRRSGSKRKPLVSEFRRRQMMAHVVGKVWPEQVVRLRNQPGFLDSLLELVDDLRTEEILTGNELRRRLEDAGLGGLGRIERVFSGYLEELDLSGGTDMPELISTAVRLLPDAWTPGSPLFMAGFDDLTGQQLEMVRRLASGERSVEVTIAVTYEPDNPGTAVSNQLVAALKELGEECGLETEEFDRSEAESDISPNLYRISRRFLRPSEGGPPALEPDDSVTLIEAAGIRNEAEAIGSEIAGLLDSGVDPDAIGIAVSSTGIEGRLIREVLERYRIPVALEAEIAASATAIGSSVGALLRAVDEDSVDDLLFWLRSPVGPDRELVDRLEFYCRKDSERSARGAVARLQRIGGTVPAWSELTDALDAGDSVLEVLARLTDQLTEGVLTADRERPPLQGTVLELRMAGAMRQALDELSELEGEGGRQIDALLDALENDAITVWSSASGRAVTIASPYGMRGKRFRHLFMAGLQEAGAHDPERPGPFLSRENRTALGMSMKADREQQDRYLFYSCLTVPTERLWLSFTNSDETGKATRRSPLVDAVEGLFEVKPRLITRNGRTPVFAMAEAPTRGEVARAAAAGLELPEALSESTLGNEVEAEVTRARETMQRTSVLGSLANRDLIEELAGDRTLSPTGVESWVRCPYRWYVEKAVRPDRFGPESDYLTLGSAVHEVLHRLFDRRAGTRPEQGTISSWLEDLDTCLAEVLEGPGSDIAGNDVRSVTLRLRIRRMARDFLQSEAEHPRDSFLPRLLEHDFGPVEMDGEVPWNLVGKIDRIDAAGPDEDHENGRVLLIDYKSGSVKKYAQAKAVDAGLIQMILYVAAARKMEELEGSAPIGGLYLPLSGAQARGGLEPGLYGVANLWNANRNEAKLDLDAWIDQGLELASEGAAGILGGILEHDPIGCRDHFEDPVVPDWSPAVEPDEESGS